MRHKPVTQHQKNPHLLWKEGKKQFGNHWANLQKKVVEIFALQLLQGKKISRRRTPWTNGLVPHKILSRQRRVGHLPRMGSGHIRKQAHVSGNSLEFHHCILVLGLISATAGKNTNWECVPTTDCAREMGHFIVWMVEMIRANFRPDHLTQVPQTTRDMLHCGMPSNARQMFGMKLARHPRKWILLHPNQNVVKCATGHEKRLAIFVPNEFSQPSVPTNCPQHKCLPVA